MSSYTYRLVAENTPGAERRIERMRANGWEPMTQADWPGDLDLGDPETAVRLRAGGFTLWRQDRAEFDERKLAEASENTRNGHPLTQIRKANLAIEEYAASLGRTGPLKGWGPIGGEGTTNGDFKTVVQQRSHPWQYWRAD